MLLDLARARKKGCLAVAVLEETTEMGKEVQRASINVSESEKKVLVKRKTMQAASTR